MEDYRRQGGIQQLLVAEQEARQIVNTARTGKVFISSRPFFLFITES